MQKTVPALDWKVATVSLWTEFMIVLSWLATSPRKWKTFVANRVSQIQEFTAGCEWRHAASTSNLADLISWGTNLETLKNCKLWWLGPKRLNQHQRQWPNIQLRGGAGKSLAQPVGQKATVTKLGIYSTYSPQSSIHFLAHSSNFCKPLKKKFRRFSVQPGLCGSNDLRVRPKMATFQLIFNPGNRW